MPDKKGIQKILEQYDFHPNKLLGQNFLIDEDILNKIIDSANLSKNDLVLEVGPGLGALTEALAERAGQVIAVEKDKKMTEIVRGVLNDRNIKNVEIINGDILKFSNSDFQNNFKVVANIPYYLTARLIRKFLESSRPPQEIILMIQKEVAQRICAKPPEMTLLSVSVQFFAQPQILFYVSKGSFWPAPKVDSAVIKIVPDSRYLDMSKYREKNLVNAFFRVVRAGFAHPRKQLINNLSAGLEMERGAVAQTMEKAGLSPIQRAETLSIEDWKILSKELLTLTSRKDKIAT